MSFQFHRLSRKYAARVAAADQARSLSAQESWHLFESHATIGTTRRGKRFKDWLFSRVHSRDADRGSAVAAGATVLLRQAMKDYLAAEFSPLGVSSLDAADAPLSAEDLLPDLCTPADEAARREYERLAQQHAEEWFAAASGRVRAALLARTLGLALSDPAVERAVGCRKSRAAELLRQTVAGWVKALRREYEGEDTEGIRCLTLAAFQEVGRLARSWAQTERPGLALLNLASYYREAAAG